MKELVTALGALDESQARTLGVLLGDMAHRADQMDNPELGDFRVSVSAVFFELEERIRENAGELSQETLSKIVWPTSEHACKFEHQMCRGLQQGEYSRKHPEVAQVWGQLACQLVIRQDLARRESRDLRRMTSGCRWVVKWEGEAEKSATLS